MTHLFNWIQQLKFARKKLWVKMIRTRPAMSRKKDNPDSDDSADRDDPNSKENIHHKYEEQLQPSTDLSANQRQVNRMIVSQQPNSV